MPMSEDIYEGFDTDTSSFNVKTIFNSKNLQSALKTARNGRRSTSFAITSSRINTEAEVFRGQLSRTGSRPLTSIRAAGFSSNPRRGTPFSKFAADIPSSAGSFGERGIIEPSSPQLQPELNDSPEMKIKEVEGKITHLVEESCIAAAKGDISDSLEKAKEAGLKERALVLQRQQLDIDNRINLDLTYFVFFNLANRYEQLGLYQEALNTYQAIIENNVSPHAGRLKVNMGNIYFRQRKYAKAIKMYRMGLDQISKAYKMVRIKVMQNIAIAFVKSKQYSNAITAYEQILQEEPDIRSALNLILCYYKVGDRSNMKYTFQRLLKVDLHLDNEDRYLPQPEDTQYETILEVIKNDELWWFEKNKKAHAELVIKMVAKLIAPAIELNFNLGYAWCIEQTMNSQYLELPNDLKIDKALMYLRQRDFHKAIETLKSFENKGTKIACTAAINLSFLYFLEGDFVQADRYADIAITADRYSPAALVNKGNILFKQAQLERARDCYLEALEDDPTCVEALYNLGLVAKQMNRLEESLNAINKIHALLPTNVMVIYQIMDIYDRMGNFEQSHDWFIQLQGLVPSDPFLLQHCGDSFERIGDKSQAFAYYYDSFKHYPCNIAVIEWLAAYYIELQLYEKSVTFFERAVLMQPDEIKWQLMIASCHRKSGNYQQALKAYKKIHNKFPESIECKFESSIKVHNLVHIILAELILYAGLQFLVRLHSDMNLSEAEEYMAKLNKAIKLREAREQRLRSASRKQSPNLSLVGRLNGSRENISGGSVRSIRRCSTPLRVSKISKTPSNCSLRSLQDYVESEGDSELRMPQEAGRGSISPYTNIVNYSDPLGPTLERPRTRTKNRNSVVGEFADDVTNDDLFSE
ncbi:hypothetical protein ACTXT7_007179 [Hymenolepis weldensis]